MKRSAPRNRVAWLAGAAAILPFAALSMVATSAAAAPQGVFAPPASRLLLTRVLHSPLADGKEVVARRSYELRIVPEGSGYRVDGELIGCAVEAPESLQALAEIERKRPDIGLFPMRLDARGMIVPAAAAPAAGELLERAAGLASEVVRRSARSAEQRRQADGFIRQLRQQPGTTRWPLDLFRPAPGHHTDSQTIALPDGSDGRVTVETQVRTGGPGGLLSAIERIVVTELGSSRRVTREEWTLAEGG